MIEVTQLSKRYDKLTAVDIPELKIPDGQSFGLVGNNGAGKTTFFSLILDLIKATTGDVKAKLERGDAFLYPSTNRHQVTEVTSGERLAIVFWIQSMIADAGKREILCDLELAYDQLRKENPTSEAAQMIQRAQSNLVRRWSEV